MASAHNSLGSDVDAAVWGVVEVNLAILSACLPTFPALLNWRSVHRRNTPPGGADPKSWGSASYPALIPDERRSGFRSGSGYAHKDALKMEDWSEESKGAERATVCIERKGPSDEEV